MILARIKSTNTLTIKGTLTENSSRVSFSKDGNLSVEELVEDAGTTNSDGSRILTEDFVEGVDMNG